jgi:DNA polymerase-4
LKVPVRKIIHCDCDCFYAAVEMRDDPRLRTLAVAVGGSLEQRGVIATCNYAARRFGVHSAMPTAHAQKLCPGLVLLPPDMEKYRAASRQILAIYRDYTDLVEPLSLDEAYLDVSASPHCRGSATLMAQEIRARIEADVGITASAGIAPNKFVAKIASDWNKPDGLFLVRPSDVDAFVAALPVGKLHGVGKVTGAKLNALGAHTCGDLRSWTLGALEHHFGIFGARLHQLCRGIDARAVCSTRQRKSVSVEISYTPDVPDLAGAQALLPALFDSLMARIARAGACACVQSLQVKIRFADFHHTTVELAAPQPQLALFRQLLARGYERGRQPLRLLGLGVRLGSLADAPGNAPGNPAQRSLFGDEAPVSTDASV